MTIKLLRSCYCVSWMWWREQASCFSLIWLHCKSLVPSFACTTVRMRVKCDARSLQQGLSTNEIQETEVTKTDKKHQAHVNCPIVLINYTPLWSLFFFFTDLKMLSWEKLLIFSISDLLDNITKSDTKIQNDTKNG